MNIPKKGNINFSEIQFYEKTNLFNGTLLPFLTKNFLYGIDYFNFVSNKKLPFSVTLDGYCCLNEQIYQ